MIQCAEAIVELKGDLVYKRRIEKRYRVREIDERIRRERTRSEAKIISEARRKGVPTPIIFDVHDYELVMERIEGDLVREVINEAISERIGEFVGILHKNSIIHGDLTTSNIILGKDNILYLIDFGLSFVESNIEAKGVDVHVFLQSLCGTHDAHEQLKEAFIKGYLSTFPDAAQILKRVTEIEQRGRYIERK
ncbi:putative bifunctional tRNA threonylcarbamoyladenosine biosynthesis protein [ANME-1 cluster archaeon GoMg2]|nr:putative bifunctional tRNA threonylcarbamoyladenosine biosynthesis protein [ANME-1 cluster archaeon GoMg2]